MMQGIGIKPGLNTKGIAQIALIALAAAIALFAGQTSADVLKDPKAKVIEPPTAALDRALVGLGATDRMAGGVDAVAEYYGRYPVAAKMSSGFTDQESLRGPVTGGNAKISDPAAVGSVRGPRLGATDIAGGGLNGPMYYFGAYPVQALESPGFTDGFLAPEVLSVRNQVNRSVIGRLHGSTDAAGGILDARFDYHGEAPVAQSVSSGFTDSFLGSR